VAEVRQEIQRLKGLRLRVRQFSKFGDDNHDAIKAQIAVLEMGADAKMVYSLRLSHYAESSAIDAVQWRDDGEEESPSEDWAPLVRQEKV